MSRFIFVSLFLQLFFIQLFAEEVDLAVSQIPDSLLSNSKAVIRFSDEILEVSSDNSAVYSKHYAITITNEDAIDLSKLVVPYDKFSRISGLSATIYDRNGKKVRKVSKSDMKDFSATSGYSIYEDNRVKYIDPEVYKVPFTIEYTYVKQYKGILAYPNWVPQQSYYVGVQKSTFSVTVPEEVKFRYRNQALRASFAKNETEKDVQYTWKTEGLLPLKPEPLAPSELDFIPMILTAPGNFEIDNYAGNAESWQNLGKWSLKLIDGRADLEEEDVLFFRALVADCKTDRDKIEALYNYLQENTRYVSIQEGIGGWQPIDAQTVNRLKYGDCKALSNYMMALLKAVGINAIYTRILAGESAATMKTDFPSNQFNHVVLSVPLEKDTVWLECTSQHNPCGYLGTFTDDRYALMVIPGEGGKLVKTPAFSEKDNLRSSNVTLTIAKNGNVTAEINTLYRGLQYDRYFPVTLGDDKDTEEYLIKNIEFPSVRLKSYKHEVLKDQIPGVKANISVDIDSYYSSLGNRLIVPLTKLHSKKELPAQRDPRFTDIQIRRDELLIDSVTFILPDGYSIENISDNAEIDSRFGSYKLEIIQKNSTIEIVRTERIKKGIFPKEAYEEIQAYYESLANYDRASVVLIKQE